MAQGGCHIPQSALLDTQLGAVGFALSDSTYLNELWC